MKKGRHRRFEEARALKRSNEVIVESCAECGAAPGTDHASWCLAMEDEDVDSGEADALGGVPETGLSENPARRS